MAWHPLFAFLIIAILIQSSSLVVSPAPNDTPGRCLLDLNAYQYEYMAFSECSSVKEKISRWGRDGFPSTLCCRNALTVLSDAMASQTRNSTGQLFLSQEQWHNCDQSFHPQQKVSMSSCGFDNLYFGSSKCSSVVLQDVRGLQHYNDASNKCSHFDNPFDVSCADCTSAILNVRESLYAQQTGKDNNDTERAICGVAALVAIAAQQLVDDPSLADKFLRCLPPPPTKNASLSRLRHPNLVCLFGCCMEGGERYLVYEFCANGNLAQHLLRRDSHLTWEARVRILRECSFALKYLHHHIEGCVVHRDIKLTNILLTEKYEAKLSDFGLSRMMGMEESKVFTDVRGTIGYMDPEYMSNAKLTCASDVYSFGIVALQILSGQKVIELDLDARDQLTRKARDVSMGKRRVSDFEDSRLKGQVDKADFGAILQIAVLCVAKSSTGRPSIEVVFDELDKIYRDMEARKKLATPTTSTSTSSSN